MPKVMRSLAVAALATALVAPPLLDAAPAGAAPQASAQSKQEKQKRKRAKQRKLAKQRAAKAFKQIANGHYVGYRGDGESLDYVLCANGRWTSNTGGGMSDGGSWKVSLATFRGSNFEAIIRDKRESSVWAMALKGGQWQIGYEFDDEAQSLGNVTRTDASEECKTL